MVSKLIIILFFLLILSALGSALYYLIQGKSDPTRLAKALTWRIALSLLLFVFLFFAFAMGWIAPNPTGR